MFYEYNTDDDGYEDENEELEQKNTSFYDYYYQISKTENDIKEKLLALKEYEKHNKDSVEFENLASDIKKDLIYEGQLFDCMISENIYFLGVNSENRIFKDKNYQKSIINIDGIYRDRGSKIFSHSIISRASSYYFYLLNIMNLEETKEFDKDYVNSCLHSVLFLDGLVYVLKKFERELSKLEKILLSDHTIIGQYDKIKEDYIDTKYSFIFHSRELCVDFFQNQIPNDSYYEQLSNAIKQRYHYDLNDLKFQAVYYLYDLLVSELNSCPFYEENRNLIITYYKYMLDYCLSMFSLEQKEEIKNSQLQKTKIITDIFKGIN